jgi:hypothetical protein
MKPIIISALVGATALFLGPNDALEAKSRIHFGFGVNSTVVAPPRPCVYVQRRAPVVYARPPVVYSRPAPIVYSDPVVVYPAETVFVYPAPAPRYNTFSFNWGFFR